jgi:nicotinate-nucleotide adenylyltransferase
MQNQEIPQQISKITPKLKVALYFGSFNPIHLGHTQLAEYLIDKELVDEVWFVVSPCNPLKQQADLLDEYLRLDMLMLAIKDKLQFKACDVEFTMPIPSYSIDTLHELSSQYPDYQFQLIIGSDNALVFDKWKKPQQILAEYPVLVYPRHEYNFSEVADQYPQMQLLDTPYFDISSTEIRQALAQKKDITQWLHPSVYQFIIENNLYD